MYRYGPAGPHVTLYHDFVLGLPLVSFRDAELEEVNELLRKSSKVHQQTLLDLQTVAELEIKEEGGRESGGRKKDGGRWS